LAFPRTAEAKETTNGVAENGEKVNGHSADGEKSQTEEPQPGPSSGAAESSNDASDQDQEEATEDGNLELAWEVLQNAAAIFERKGTSAFVKLMDVFIEMAGISLENGNCDDALKDFQRALDVFDDLEESDQNKRIAAEVYYKMGLCQALIKVYEESFKSFQQAADLIAEVIAVEKARPAQTDDVLETIKDLEETQQEILNKITEVEGTKTEEIEQVKKEMSKMFGPATTADGAGSSSSAAVASGSGSSQTQKTPETDKPKPTDISHLIKRKKPDSNDVEESPAKKKAVETSPGEKISVDVKPAAEDKLQDEPATVQVVLDD